MKRFFVSGFAILSLNACQQARLEEMAPPAQAPSRRILLADAELDAVTAGGVSFETALWSSATGASAASETNYVARANQTLIYRVTLATAGGGFIHVIGAHQERASVGVAAGSALAKGAQSARCGATIIVLGSPDYSRSLEFQKFAPGTAVCLCSAIAISIIH